VLQLGWFSGRLLASDMGGPWIKSQAQPFFQYRDKTSEYSEIYREQLTSEHFLPYNYRSSTLPRISRNIGRLLRQCGGSAPSVMPLTVEFHVTYLSDRAALCVFLSGLFDGRGMGQTATYNRYSHFASGGNVDLDSFLRAFNYFGHQMR
jgi:hypothetical protein